MKKWNPAIVVVLYFALSACTSTSQSDEQFPLLDYCDLVTNPSQYHEQVVRVSANHITGFEWSYLADEDCPMDSSSNANHTWIIIPGDTTLCEGVTQVENSTPPWNWQGGSLERRVTIVGKFYNTRGDHLNFYPFQMEFMCLEKAGKLRAVR